MQVQKNYKLLKHISANSKINHKWKFYHDRLGYNYRLSNLAAVRLFSNFKVRLFLKKRSNLYTKYMCIFLL